MVNPKTMDLAEIMRTKPSAEAEDADDRRNVFRRWMEYCCLPGASGIRPEPEDRTVPPDSELLPQHGESVDQKEIDRVKRLAVELGARGRLFARQGTVVATWRMHKGNRLGPYYRLAYREDGRQKSIYLGASAWVARQVRWLLARLQTPLRQGRSLERVRAVIRASLRRHQAQAQSLFGALGVQVKGLRYPGLLSHLRDLLRSREAVAHQRRVASAWRVITGQDEGGTPQTYRTASCPSNSSA